MAAIRDSDPTTPKELLRAISLLIPLERTDLAHGYLERLQNLNLDDAAKAQLQKEFGSGLLIRLSRQKELGPKVLSSCCRCWKPLGGRPPIRSGWRSWSSQLAGESRQGRYEAAEQLMRAGPHAMPPLLNALVQDHAPTLEQSASAIVAELGDAAVPPLAAFLTSPNVQQRAQAVTLLGYTKSTDAMPYLVRPYFASDPAGRERSAAATAWQQVAGQLPQREAALQILRGAAERAYVGNPPGPVDNQEQLSWWSWNAESQTAVADWIPVRDAAALVAARHYGDLAQLLPDATADRRRTGRAATRGSGPRRAGPAAAPGRRVGLSTARRPERTSFKPSWRKP